MKVEFGLLALFKKSVSVTSYDEKHQFCFRNFLTQLFVSYWKIVFCQTEKMFSLNHEAQIVQEIVEEQFEPKDNDMPDLVEIKTPKKNKFAAKFGKQ